MNDQHEAVLARFERKILPPEALAAIEASTRFYRDQAAVILHITPAGRERALALTALEEAKFWTNQAIATGGPAQSTYRPDAVNEVARAIEQHPASGSLLDLEIGQDDVANVETVGEYLAEIFVTLLSEEEGFDPKRPLGNSDWMGNIETALIAANATRDRTDHLGIAELKDAVITALTKGRRS